MKLAGIQCFLRNGKAVKGSINQDFPDGISAKFLQAADSDVIKDTFGIGGLLLRVINKARKSLSLLFLSFWYFLQENGTK